MRILTVPHTSRISGGSGATRSGSYARELIDKLERDYGLGKPSAENRGKLEFSDGQRDERPPAELKLPGVVSVQRNFQTGQQTIKYGDGRMETRAFVIAPDLVRGRPSQPQRESPRVIVAAQKLREENQKCEAEAREKEALRLKFLAEVREEQRLAAIYEKYSKLDSLVARPPDFDAAERAWNAIKDREVKRQVDDILSRVVHPRKEKAIPYRVTIL